MFSEIEEDIVISFLRNKKLNRSRTSVELSLELSTTKIFYSLTISFSIPLQNPGCASPSLPC